MSSSITSSVGIEWRYVHQATIKRKSRIPSRVDGRHDPKGVICMRVIVLLDGRWNGCVGFSDNP